jgi:hypothetical protein
MTGTYMGTTVVHEMSERCNGLHCHSCGLDEGGNAFQWCLECGHGYRTENDLFRAYRKGLLSTITRRSPWLRSNEFEASVVSILWRAFRLRMDQIHFCPLCLHDF